MTSETSGLHSIRPARTHDPREVDQLYDICLRTGNDGKGAEDLLTDPRVLGEVYLGAYLRFQPELAFVLQGPDGAVVGYVLGAADTLAFEARLEKEWWPALRARYPLGDPSAEGLHNTLVQLIHTPIHSDPSVTKDYPAHLHVDILQEGQGGGNGRRLLETLFDALRAKHVPGVHLTVSPSNTNAVGFYEHLGFHQVPEGPMAMTL